MLEPSVLKNVLRRRVGDAEDRSRFSELSDALDMAEGKEGREGKDGGRDEEGGEDNFNSEETQGSDSVSVKNIKMNKNRKNRIRKN